MLALRGRTDFYLSARNSEGVIRFDPKKVPGLFFGKKKLAGLVSVPTATPGTTTMAAVVGHVLRGIAIDKPDTAILRATQARISASMISG
jgi:hypothetical protein